MDEFCPIDGIPRRVRSMACAGGADDPSAPVPQAYCECIVGKLVDAIDPADAIGTPYR